MARPLSRGQTIRRALILLSALLFPVTMFYFSPGLVFRGARFGIVNGSLVTFGVLLLSATILGRAFCGWLCPGAGFGEACMRINARAAHTGRAGLIKWVIWTIWITGLALVAIFVGGGYREVDLLLGTSHGISIHRPGLFLYYFIVVGVIVGLSLFAGRRGFCHYVCWMAPFMIIGRRVGTALHLPALHLRATPTACTGCGTCTTACPMSLSLEARAQTGDVEHDACVLCGACVDACPSDALDLGFGPRPAEGVVARASASVQPE